MYKHLAFVAALSISLTACGGGGSDSPAPVDPKLSQAIVNGAQAATPAPVAAYRGAYVMLAGESVGYVEGPNEKALATTVANIVVNDPVKYAVLYRMLLADAGLSIVVTGNKIGNSSINNAPIYAPDVKFVAKLTTNGVVVTQA